MSLLSFLDRAHTVAKPGFSRWMVPPAALCVHLCIGQAYAFSVFNLPMTKLLGVSQSTAGDWKLTELGWIFSIAIFFLGASAAVFGRWVEEGGPRRAMSGKRRRRGAAVLGDEPADGRCEWNARGSFPCRSGFVCYCPARGPSGVRLRERRYLNRISAGALLNKKPSSSLRRRRGRRTARRAVSRPASCGRAAPGWGTA